MRVAIIGASSDRRKYGNKAVRTYSSKGHTVFPVNPGERKIEGLRCYGSVLEIPGRVDVALFYVPPAVGLKVISEVAKKGIKNVYLNPGAGDERLLEKARKLGVKPILACAIKAIGLLPSDF